MGKRRKAKKRKQHTAVKKSSIGNLPNYLAQKEITPSEVPHPPVQAKLQNLPFKRISWEDFQDLCKFLVEADPEIRKCNNYGTQGEKQKGVDLIAYPKINSF